MKKFDRVIAWHVIILIITFFFLVSCGGGGGSSPSVNVTDPDIPVIIPDDDPDPLAGGVKYVVFQDGETVKFFNGSSVYVGYTGASCYVDDRTITVNNTLYYMDSDGNITEQFSLNITPDFCAVDTADNVWTGEIEGSTLKVYKNNVYQKTINAVIVSMFSCGDGIIAISNVGAYYDVSGTKTAINSAAGFVVYDFNSDTRTAKIDGISVSWTTNFFNTAKEWNGAYSWNGYKWDGATLTENGSALTCWRLKANYPITLPENAVVISAGSLIFAGERHYFFLECNSGWLFKYIPVSDMLVQVKRLYTGDGLRATGIYYSKIIQPVCSYDSLYFKFDDGGLYRLRFDSLEISYIDFCDGYVRAW